MAPVQFRVAGLSPATYDVSAELAGFATLIRRSVTLAIGQTVISDFRLKPSKVATVVEVTDQPPVVETERGSQADRISQEYITDLPIDRPRLPYVYVARAGCLRCHPVGGGPGFQSQANTDQRPVVLRQQWQRKQRHCGRVARLQGTAGDSV